MYFHHFRDYICFKLVRVSAGAIPEPAVGGFFDADGRMAAELKEHTGPAAGRAARGVVAALFRVSVCLVGLAAMVGSVQASPPRTDAVSLYQGQGVDANLINVLPKLFTGDLRFERTYFTAAGYYHPLETPRGLQSVLDFLHVPDTGAGFELIAAKHHGMQHNAEVDAAYALRFSKMSLYAFTVRFGIDFGLSYAFGRPSYEDGSVDDPDRRYRFQSYGAYELEWGHGAAPRISFVTRIHHRSGIYGLIAPRQVGSNFLALGLRYGF